MSQKVTYKSAWDFAGITASILCAIHCLFLPLLFSTIPVLGIELLGNLDIEILTIFFSLFVGIRAFYSGRKKHLRTWPLCLFVTGMAFLALSIFWHGEEVIIKALAVVSIVVAHMANWKLGKSVAMHPSNN